jgi:hypothetical protein
MPKRQDLTGIREASMAALVNFPHDSGVCPVSFWVFKFFVARLPVVTVPGHHLIPFLGGFSEEMQSLVGTRGCKAVTARPLHFDY